MNIRNTRTPDLLAFCGVILLALITLPLKGVVITNNGAWYLYQAMTIYTGSLPPFYEGGLIARGPLFPFILALSFLIKDVAVEPAFLLTRAFVAADLVLVYLIGRILYGRILIGLMAASMVFTSAGIYQTQAMLDTGAVIVFFMLSFVLFYCIALRDQKKWLFVPAGLALGLGFLTKESSIAFLFVPFLSALLMDKERRLTAWQGCVIVLATWVICVAPWVLYVYSQAGDIYPALGAFNPKFLAKYSASLGFERSASAQVANLMGSFPKYLGELYIVFFAKSTTIAPLLVLSWAYILLRFCRLREIPDTVLVTSALSFLPVLFGSVVNEAGMRQGLVIMYLSYLVLGLALNDLMENLVRLGGARLGWIRGRASGVLGLFILGILFSVVQLLWQGGSLRFMRAGYSALAIMASGNFEVYSRYTNEHHAAAKWIQANLRKDQMIAADGVIKEPLDFFLRMQYPLVPIDNMGEVNVDGKPHSDRGTFGTPDNRRLLFVLVNRGFRYGVHYRYISLFYEDPALQSLSRRGVEYLAFSIRALFFRRYLDRAHWAKRVFGDKAVFIYRVNRKEISPVRGFSLCVGADVKKDLKWLQETSPEEFERLVGRLEKHNADLPSLEKASCIVPWGEY